MLNTGQMPEDTSELEAQFVDELTGLPNRAWLNENLQRAIIQHPGACAILFVDLDGLKGVNDSKGHEAGDKLIKDAANVLRASVRHSTDEREGDLVIKGRPNRSDEKGAAARLGGDEFVVLLNNVKDEDGANTVKSRILENFAANSLSGSIGIAVHSSTKRETPSELLKRADEAMYIEKNARKKEIIDSLPRRKRVAGFIGHKLLRYAGLTPPR